MTEQYVFDGALIEALHFTPGDLAYNRSGQLSEGQRKRLERERLKGTVLLAGFGLFFAAVPIGAALTSQVGDGGCGVLVFAALAATFLWLAIRYWSKFSADLCEGRVLMVQGRVSFTIGRGRHPRYFVNIGHVQLWVSRRALLAFKDREPYLLYYLPRTQELVAAEPVINVEMRKGEG